MKFFGFYILKKEQYEKIRSSNDLDYLSKNIDLEKKLEKINKELEEIKKIRPVIDLNIGDPSPSDVEARKIYVAEVAGLHKKILSPKLMQMISNSLNELADQTNTRDLDLITKGIIFALWEIERWGNIMVGEQIEYQIGEGE